MSHPTRRDVLVGASALAAAACTWRPTMSARMPVVFLPHGGGPWPWMEPEFFGGPGALDGLTRFLQGVPGIAPERPKALLVVTAHWEERVPTVSTAAKPGMLYDYYGFPEHTYKVTWPAPGEPALAARVLSLLRGAGIDAAANDQRGYDHGTFVPLSVAWPAADVPTVQLSLQAGLDPAAHIAIGRALAPLRDEGVFILGSGMSYHNMRGFRTPAGQAASEQFDAWLGEAVTAAPAERDAALSAWASAPGGRASHPREEHLLPLMVVAGAAGADRGVVPYRDQILGTKVSAVRFG